MVPALLLPGTLCDARAWRHQAEALAGMAEVVVPDLGGAASVGALAEAVLAAAPPRFLLAGFSFGGFVALQVAARAPGRVLGLCLVSTNARPMPPDRAAALRAAVAGARASGLGQFVAEALWPSYVAPHRLGDMALRAEVVAMAEALGADVFARQTEANIARPDARALLPALHLPCEVVCGALDPLCPPALHREMAEAIAGAALTVVPEAGHFVPLEAPGAVSDALARLAQAAPDQVPVRGGSR